MTQLTHLSAGATVLVLALAGAPPAGAAPFTDTNPDSAASLFTVPSTGVYDILAYGAQGGEGGVPTGTRIPPGAKGRSGVENLT